MEDRVRDCSCDTDQSDGLSAAVFNWISEQSDATHRGHDHQKIQRAIRRRKNYYVWLRKLYASKYEKIKEALQSSPLKLEVMESKGGYVMLANIEKAVAGMPLKFFYSDFKTSDRPGVLEKFEDWRDLDNPDHSPDFAFCFYMMEVYGVILFPVSGMTEKVTLPPKEKSCVQFVRAALSRKDETIAALMLKLSRK